MQCHARDTIASLGNISYHVMKIRCQEIRMIFKKCITRRQSNSVVYLYRAHSHCLLDCTISKRYAYWAANCPIVSVGATNESVLLRFARRNVCVPTALRARMCSKAGFPLGISSRITQLLNQDHTHFALLFHHSFHITTSCLRTWL